MSDIAARVLRLIAEGWSTTSAITSACLSAGIVLNDERYDEIMTEVKALR